MLKANILSHWSAEKRGAPDLGTARHDLNLARSYAFSDGTGVDQANALFADKRTLAASASEDLDLAGGITDALGATLTLSAVKAIRIHAAAANGGNITVGGAAANAFIGPFGAAAHTVSIPPNGIVELINPSAAGWAVVAGTGDLLRVTNANAGAAADYTIEILGEA